MTTIEIAWLAGLLEGEGAFIYPDIVKRRYPRVMFDTTDKDVAERVAGLMKVTVRARTMAGPKHFKQVYLVRFSGSRAVGLMMTIYPLMGHRRRAKIAECLTLWRNRPDRWQRDSTNQARGTRHPHAKLGVADVAYIRETMKTGAVSKAAMGRRLGVTSTTVRGVLSGRTWRHV